MINQFTCDCFQGYEGLLCDQMKDFCASAPCQNGAACLNDNVNLKYVCTCKPGKFNIKKKSNKFKNT